MTSITDYFENIQLPTMPEVARLLVQSLNDDEIPFEKVRSAISRDQALTVKLIRLANSARFGLQRKVSSVDDAITMVGLNQVRTLCLAACMSNSFPVSSGLNREEFWKESMACAGFSHWLARTIGADVQQSWLTGFMVRLGDSSLRKKSLAKSRPLSVFPMPQADAGSARRSWLDSPKARLPLNWPNAGTSPKPSALHSLRPQILWRTNLFAAWAALCISECCWPK